MRIVVFVKYVPDAAGDRTFTNENVVDRATDGILSELDEYPLEEALTIAKDAGGDSEVIAVTVGPADAKDAVRKALQMGANRGVHVLDDALAGTDAFGTSRVLAAVVENINAESPVDLVLTGLASTDGAMSIVPVAVAERLGWPAATVASAVEVSGTTVKIRRDGDVASQFVEVTLPALVSVTDQINDPRYPSFKGIMGAKRKKIAELGLDDLGISPDEVGAAGATTVIDEIAARPPRSAGEIITDEGDGGAKLVEFLAGQKLV